MKNTKVMDTNNKTSNKRRSKIVGYVYLALFVLMTTGLIYVLAVNMTKGNLFASGQTPLGELILGFVQGTLQTSAASPAFAPLALLAAFAVGGLHALTPGHNKTLTGAYLVGARARPLHAVLIGGATAVSHTASTIVIGVLTLSVAGQMAGAQYLRWVGLPSGILTVFLGIWLLGKQFGVGGATDHDHGHLHLPGQTHDHWHPQDRSYLDRITLSGLVLMGLTHGIVPTFDAIAILMVALSVKQLSLGIGLIAMYSAGIASVLIAIGLLFLRVQNLLLDSPQFARLSRWAPTLGAVVVIILGLWLIVRTLIAL